MGISDQAIGYVIIGAGLVTVLMIVFAISTRAGAAARPRPPRGVHLPPPSSLPVVLSLAAFLIGAGLAFRGEDWIINPFLGAAGLLVLLAGAVSWVRTAGREWRDVEHGSHDDTGGH